MQPMNTLTPEDVGCEIEHHFSSGVYAKQTLIPEGVCLEQHKHTFDHMSILASGRAQVDVEDSTLVLDGPAVIEIVANKAHKVTAITPCVWFCIHATEETDPEKIDHTLIANEQDQAHRQWIPRK